MWGGVGNTYLVLCDSSTSSKTRFITVAVFYVILQLAQNKIYHHTSGICFNISPVGTVMILEK